MTEESLFAAALERTAVADRRAFLDLACSGDPDLRRRVERLLAAHEKTLGILDQSAGTSVAPEDASWPPPGGVHPGGRVGPPAVDRYELLEKIGEGGMGTVWLAEQTEPVRRKVAVKLIKPGMDSRPVLARFEAERQALALMDHPNIAKVLDGGAAEDGRPFFVMEYVEGVPITQYCDDARLSIPQRLELFVPVCQAVQHAHTKGIIHRDLKPSNVLVALYDGEPVPKVIDFGVAKATGPNPAERTTLTRDGQLVGTPQYMSPEQAVLSGLDVDTRSDVYALGVLLYELLTGSTPFDKEALGDAAFYEILRVIREVDPPSPSRRLSATAELPGIAARRGTEPSRLGRLVKGDLDWIVMKALEKDRDRRYGTANSLAMDLQRYLADQPVEARPPSTSYRLRKFARRNKGPLAASAALTLSLIAGVGSVIAVQAKADRDRAALAVDRAARKSWTTASVAAALRDARERVDEAWGVVDHPDRMRLATDAAVAALRRADDFVAGGTPTETTLAELASARRAVDELARHHRLIAAHEDNRQKFADELTGNNALEARAGLCIRQAEALRQFGLDPVDGPADEVARAVAASRLRDALLGMLLEWHGHAAALSEARPKNPGRIPDSPAVDDAVDDRLWQVARSARRLCGGAYARWQDLLDRDDVPGLVDFAASPDALSFRSSLAGALGRDLLRAGQYPAGRDFLRAAADRYPHDVWLHFDLFHSCSRMQPPDYAEALRHMSAASVLRPDSPLIHLQLGACYAGLKSYDQAVAAYRKSLALSPDSAIAHSWLGLALLAKNDEDGAIAAFREAVRLMPANPAMLVDLGAALADAGRPAEGLRVTLAAMRQDPARAEDPRNHLRYNAACLAMNCADGKGEDTPPPAERAACRKQALDLLTAELASMRGLPAADRAFVDQSLPHWLADKDLASVRDPMALEQLPPDERDAWKTLWAEVRDLRDRPAPQADR
jgi:serine/threonine protein kinase/tetratricopeptide (TPR) repeat protein